MLLLLLLSVAGRGTLLPPRRRGSVKLGVGSWLLLLLLLPLGSLDESIADELRMAAVY